MRLFTVSHTDHANDLQAAPPGALRHLDDDLADAARRDDDHDVPLAEREVAEDLLGVTGRLLQVQALSQTVRADDQVVEGQTQLDDRVPADKTPLPRGHLFAEHAAVADAEKMY